MVPGVLASATTQPYADGVADAYPFVDTDSEDEVETEPQTQTHSPAAGATRAAITASTTGQLGSASAAAASGRAPVSGSASSARATATRSTAATPTTTTAAATTAPPPQSSPPSLHKGRQGSVLGALGSAGVPSATPDASCNSMNTETQQFSSFQLLPTMVSVRGCQLPVKGGCVTSR